MRFYSCIYSNDRFMKLNIFQSFFKQLHILTTKDTTWKFNRKGNYVVITMNLYKLW